MPPKQTDNFVALNPIHRDNTDPVHERVMQVAVNQGLISAVPFSDRMTSSQHLDSDMSSLHNTIISLVP